MQGEMGYRTGQTGLQSPFLIKRPKLRDIQCPFIVFFLKKIHEEAEGQGASGLACMLRVFTRFMSDVLLCNKLSPKLCSLKQQTFIFS